MATAIQENYSLSASRYQHYYRQLWKFYEKPSVKVSLALLLTVFTILIFAVFAIRPTLTTIAELVREIDDQKIVLEKMEEKAAALASAQQAFIRERESIVLLNEAIPAELEVQSLIEFIEATATSHKLPLSNLSLREVVYEKLVYDEDTLVEIPFTISTEADYEVLHAFLTDLLRLPRYIVLDSMSFSEPRNNGNEDQVGSELSLQLRALYYSDAREVLN